MFFFIIIFGHRPQVLYKKLIYTEKLSTVTNLFSHWHLLFQKKVFYRTTLALFLGLLLFPFDLPLESSFESEPTNLCMGYFFSTLLLILSLSIKNEIEIHQIVYQVINCK